MMRKLKNFLTAIGFGLKGFRILYNASYVYSAKIGSREEMKHKYKAAKGMVDLYNNAESWFEYSPEDVIEAFYEQKNIFKEEMEKNEMELNS